VVSVRQDSQCRSRGDGEAGRLHRGGPGDAGSVAPQRIHRAYGWDIQAAAVPGSTPTSANNGGVSALVRTLVVEIPTTRVNALRPGVVGDSPARRDRTPMTGLDGRTVTMSDVVDATDFLLRNRSVNGIDLYRDGHRHSRH
jgi:hypothetical protein